MQFAEVIHLVVRLNAIDNSFDGSAASSGDHTVVHVRGAAPEGAQTVRETKAAAIAAVGIGAESRRKALWLRCCVALLTKDSRRRA